LQGTYYTERFGNSDDLAADTIRTPPGYNRNPPPGQFNVAPGCFLKGVTVTADYTLQNNTGGPLGVTIFVSLYNHDDGDEYWSATYGTPTAPLPYPDIHSITLPPLPNHIANSDFSYEFEFYVLQDGIWNHVWHEGIVDMRLHTVLSQPQTPMNIPWDPVLEIACRWMRKTSTAENAQRQLTKTMMGVLYDSSNKPYTEDWRAVWIYEPENGLQYTRWIDLSDARAGERFYLRAWLNASSNGTIQTGGECTDVSNLWVIMATAVGCPQVPQLINNPNSPTDNFYFNSGYWAGRTTEGLLPYYDSGTGLWYPFNIPDRPAFNYHQVGWSLVYDAAIAFRDTTYYIGWTDGNGNGVIDPGEYQATAKIAINIHFDAGSPPPPGGNYASTDWLWAGTGPPMTKFWNPPLEVRFETTVPP